MSIAEDLLEMAGKLAETAIEAGSSVADAVGAAAEVFDEATQAVLDSSDDSD